MIVDKFSQTQKGETMLPSLRMITMSSPYHRPVAAVSATHSHATQNTDASVTGGTGTGITGITGIRIQATCIECS